MTPPKQCSWGIVNDGRSALRGLGAQPEKLRTVNGKTAPNALGDVNDLSREAIEALPAAVYMTDAEGRITFYNEAAAALWGCRPELGDSKFCGSWKLYWPDGTPLPHDECPMAMALLEKRPIRGMEAVAERPDGTRISFIPCPTPLFDATGRLTGAVNMLVDVSELRRAEQDNQQLAAIVDASEDAIISKDLSGIITSWNSGAERLFGYAKREVIGKSITLVIPSHLRDEEASIIDQIARGERIEHFETARQRKDGTLVSVSLSISPVRSGRGTVVGASTIARDISERKKAEAALHESEARLAGQRKALELALNGEPLAISLGVLVRTATDQLGEGVRAAFYLANPAHTRVHHVVGMSAAYAEAVVDGFEIGPASLSCGLATHTGLPILTPDVAKEPRWTPWLWLAEKFDYRGCWSFPIRTEAGRFVGTLAIYWRRPREATPRELELAAVLTATAAIIIARHTDAEQRDQAQAALRESAARLRESHAQLALAGRAALVGTHAYDPDLERMTISEGYAAIHGLPEGTKETTRTEWLARIHPDDLGRLEENRARTFRDRRDVYNVDYRIVRANGEVRWIEARCIVSYNSAGHPQRVIGINIDVTERKRAEQHQRALNAELDHRVKNVLATVSAIIAQTQEASSSQADFVTGLNSRINSLARTHELLSESNWRGAPLAEVVQREFAPYTTGNTVSSGPSVTLEAEAAQAVASVLHELVTNAAKYGALSNRNGRVSVQWRWLQNGRHDRLLIEWQESGGPPVLAPSRSGYGTTIIRELIPFEFGGEVELSFASDGVKCRLEISHEWARKEKCKAEESKVS